MNLYDIPPRQTQSYLTELLKSRNIWPKNKMGQNFLIDLNLMDLVVNSANLQPSDAVLEVGSGTGSLSNRLVEAAGFVLSVELDPAFQKLTEETVIERDRFFLHRGDILKGKNQIQPQVTEKLAEITSMPGISGYKLVANLPYAVATPVMSNLLISRIPPTKIVAMVQLEIAEKIISKPTSKDFGALPILFQSLAKVEIVRRISPAAFWPRPKVDSAIIKIDPSPLLRSKLVFEGVKPEDGPLCFRNFLRGLYVHRRKNLRGALLSMPNNKLSKAEIDAKLVILDIKGEVRAETLSPLDHFRLCSQFGAGVFVSGETDETAD